MHCPFCNNEETKVIDSRLAGEGQQIRRRRECLKCGERFTTFETAELVMPRVIVHTGRALTRKETRADRASRASLMLESVDMVASEEDQAPCFLVRS